MRLSGVAAALFVSLIVETASAEPVALHFSGTVRTSLYGDVINGEFDWSTLPNGSAVSGCLSYDAAQAPTNVVLDGQVAVFYPLSASEVFVDTVAGRFANPADVEAFGQAFTGPAYNGYSFAVQPMVMPAGWTSDQAYLAIQLYNDFQAGAPVSALQLPTDLDVTSVSTRDVVLDFLMGVTNDVESTTRRIQVRATLESGTWTAGSCAAVDSDGDGLLDPEDACPNSPELPVDATGCSVSDLVPCSGNYGSHGAYVAALAQASRSFVEQGLLTPQQRQALLKNAAQSSCGQ